MRLLVILSLCICMSCSQKEERRVSQQPLEKAQISHFHAGDSIVLKFNADEVLTPRLLINSSLGSTTIPGKKVGSSWEYQWPSELARQAGPSSWILLKQNSSRPNGTVFINPEVKRHPLIETYLGPKSIRVGGEDPSMLVALPTDIYDNLLPEGSPVFLTHQVERSIAGDSAATKNGLVWTNLYAPEKSGIMLASAAYKESQSKELSIELRPQKAVDFTIFYEQIHPYADGNQLLTLSTSRITDTYGNTISDGTLVNFEISTSEGKKLSAMATTITGVATTSFLHPQWATNWQIEAYITGIADSKPLSLDFKPAFDDYSITVNENNRKLVIEPIRSFMDQLIPDGMSILWEISNEAGRSNKESGSTRLGQGQLILEPGLYPPGKYKVSVVIGGIKKTLNLNLSNDPME